MATALADSRKKGGRSINTSLTTLLVLGSLFLFGGEAIHDFSLALILGVLIGTYSSIYVAASMLVLLKTSREDMIVVERKEERVRPGDSKVANERRVGK